VRRKIMAHYKSEVRDGMRIDWDEPNRMKDGVTRRADVFRPVEAGLYPVLARLRPLTRIS
jgi:predicted acyl esterase